MQYINPLTMVALSCEIILRSLQDTEAAREITRILGESGFDEFEHTLYDIVSAFYPKSSIVTEETE